GPFSWAELQQMAAEGKLQPADMVLQEGTPKWQAASTVPSLLPAPTPAKAAPLAGATVRFHIRYTLGLGWGYDDDPAALIVLLPKGQRDKLPGGGRNPAFAGNNLDQVQQLFRERGAYLERARWDGTAAIEAVPPGEYTLVIVSFAARYPPGGSRDDTS